MSSSRDFHNQYMRIVWGGMVKESVSLSKVALNSLLTKSESLKAETLKALEGNQISFAWCFEAYGCMYAINIYKKRTSKDKFFRFL